MSRRRHRPASRVSDVDADPATPGHSGHAQRHPRHDHRPDQRHRRHQPPDHGGGNGTARRSRITATQNQINATLAAANGLTYTPTANYNGTDTLTVTTNDHGFNGNDPGLTGTGTTEQDSDTITINIAAVVDIANDAPSFAEDSGAQNFNLLANDTFENAGRAITSVTQGAHGGTVTINNNGTPLDATDDFVVYTQVADYNGADSFTYTVTSGGVTETGTVNVTITAIADIADDNVSVLEDSGVNALNGIGNPVSLLANDISKARPAYQLGHAGRQRRHRRDQQ